MTTANNAPKGFFDYVLKNVVDPNATMEENIQAAIKETWNQAQVDTSRDLSTNLERYLETDDLIAKKVARVRNVLRDTINKSNLVAPARFAWAVTGRTDYHVVGVYRNEAQSYQTPRYVSVTKKGPNGKVISLDPKNDFLGVKNEGTNANLTYFPISWLSLSDGDLSKMIRNEAKSELAKKRTDRIAAAKKEKELVEKNLHKLLKELEDLESKTI